MMNFNKFVAKAREIFVVQRVKTIHMDPILFLYTQKWNVPVGPAFSEDTLSRMNMEFDERGCFGRAVKAAVLSEVYFPESKIFAGEVLDDYSRCFLLDRVTDSQWNDETYIAEIIQNENPHIIILDEKGKQFDPLFSYLSSNPETLRHPEVGKHNLWEGLYAAYLISIALSVRRVNPVKSIEMLHEAESLCPEFLTVKENLSALYGMTGQFEKAIKYLQFTIDKRKSAEKLFVLWVLSENDMYKDQLIEQYDIRMFTYLKKMYMS